VGVQHRAVPIQARIHGFNESFSMQMLQKRRVELAQSAQQLQYEHQRLVQARSLQQSLQLGEIQKAAHKSRRRRR
jgi:hypothetical protein